MTFNKTRSALVIGALFGLSALAGCNTTSSSSANMRADAPESAVSKSAPAPSIGRWGVDLNGMDKSVNPGDDFNEYVNGTYLDSLTIPDDKARFGTFDMLREAAVNNVNAIILDFASGKHSQDPNAKRVAALYNAWMDEATINAKGMTQAQQHLDFLYQSKSVQDLFARAAKLGLALPIDAGIIPDPADTSRYALFASQGGLTLPDRDYYLSDDKKFAHIRSEFQAYIAQMLTLSGIAKPQETAKAIYELELAIAKVHWSKEDNRNIQKIYNPMPPAKLQGMVASFDTTAHLASRGIKEAKMVVVAQPDAISAIDAIIKNASLTTLKDYFAFHFVNTYADYISSDHGDAQFALFAKTMRGIEAKKPRAERGAELVNNYLGEAVGQEYVKRHFPPAAKAQMMDLIENLKTAFAERLKQNTWMDEQTRLQALLKLSTFEAKIGYPDKWKDYSSLTLDSKNALGNVLSLKAFAWQEQVAKFGSPVDRDEWPYPPQTVNASYNPLMNQITFPAGILQAPFFDPNADAAVNYGAIGAVIGHEIGHGFDDMGRRFDEKGRIRDWWSKEANTNFERFTAKLIAQYDAYSPLEGVHVNGTFTLGENIGDLGGLEMAYSAYQLHLQKSGARQVIDGYTPEQRFFLGFGQIWRSKYRDDALRTQIATDPHSPTQYRINGVVRNVDAWYQAFGVEKDHALYLDKEARVTIW